MEFLGKASASESSPVRKQRPDSRQKLLREQLLNDQRLLTASRGPIKTQPTFTFGNLIPKANQQSEKYTYRLKRKEKSGENLKVTDLLENIRKEGSKVRMEFISRRMGALRGEEQTDAYSILNIIKNNIKASARSDTEKTPPFISNISNLLDFPGKPSFDRMKQDTGVIKNLARGMRFVNKLEDNEMLKLIHVDQKCMSYLLSKKKPETNPKTSLMQSLKLPQLAPVIEEKDLSFMFLGDRHSAIRNFLLNSGWFEKNNTAEEQTYVRRLLQTPNKSYVEEPARFIWLNGWLNWTSLSQRVIVSRIPSNSPFNKTNMAIALRNTMPFLYEKSEINARIPRTYEVRTEGDMKNFQKHYRITACICLLKKFVASSQSSFTSPDGTVPLESVDFAVKRAVELLQLSQHEDLDEWNFSIVKDSEWEHFLLRFYDIAHYDAKFQPNETFDLNKMYSACKKLLEMIYRVFPEMKYEGMKNLWICKPSNGSCGRGVRVFRKLSDIEKHCKPESSYVIQKYIEMPLLIYNTKFDIRQWFLITSVSPLIIWMYDECYLRFCSQEFCLNNLHESVHLCNNTVQWKYKNGIRSSKLPNENMWDNQEFASFLKKELKQDQWPQIQDQMRQAIIATCIATQDRMFHRSNSFQLFGADFMLTPDFKVWLIEINSQPAMKYSTSVTTRLCKAVLEDTIKAGLLRKSDPSMKVGKFREIYHQTSEYPKTILPPSGIVHSKKSTFLPNNSSNVTLEAEISPIPKPITNKPSKISYEHLATYKTHHKIQIKPRVKSDNPLYPGDAAQSIVEENVILNESVVSSESKKTDEPIQKIENNTTKKDGKTPLPKKTPAIKNIPGRNISEKNQNNKISKLKDHLNKKERTKIYNNKIISKKDNLKMEEISRSIIETTKQAISNIKLISNLMKKKGSHDELSFATLIKCDEETIGVQKKYSIEDEMSTEDEYVIHDIKKTTSKNTVKIFENSSEMINLLAEEDSQGNMSLVDKQFGDEANDNDAKEGRIAFNELDGNESFADVFTHDIITGKELLPELSGYAFIGESCDDRKLECILNSSEFLSCIGKSDEKIRPIFRSYIDCE